MKHTPGPMYEALKWIPSELPTKRDWMNHDYESLVRAAIAKAEGK